MSLLSFLKSAKVEEVIEDKKKPGGGIAKERNPNPALLAIRVWKDGSVYPSQALVDKFDLEYKGGSYETTTTPAVMGEDGTTEVKPATVKTAFVHSNNPGNGMDVIDSRFWNGYKADGHMLFIGATPKTASKVDLFAATRYDKDGKPTGSVMKQGAATFGEDVLIPAIKELYGIELGEEKEYVDMIVTADVEGFNVSEHFSKSIIYAPKRVVRGKEQGKPDYVRRENMTVFAFVPQEILTPAEAPVATEPAEATV